MSFMVPNKQSSFITRFWQWYERYYTLNVSIAAGLFLLQLVHLYWLTTDVIFLRLMGESYFNPSPFWEYIIIIVDYAEIPAILSTSVVYINEIRTRTRTSNLAYHIPWLRPVVFLLLINSQWLHLFWITDEFIVSRFVTHGLNSATTTYLPVWLAWIAIFIDYLELPVIFDTVRKTLRSVFS